MNLIFDNRLQKKYESYLGDKKRKLTDVSEIVIHGTGGGQSAQGIITWMLGGERDENYKRGIGLFHFEIDSNGDVYSLFPLDYWFYHSHSGYHDKITVGIELLNKEEWNKGMYTEEQYVALLELVDWISQRCPVSIITGHGANYRKYSNGDKECPGTNFMWHKIEQAYDFELVDDERYKLL